MFQISKSRSILVAAAGAILLAVAAFSFAAQTQQPPPGGGGGMHVNTAPKNLKVLPKDTNIDQLDKYMQEWKAALGGHCFTCHYVKNQGQMGQPGAGQGQPGGGQMSQPGGSQMGSPPGGGSPPEFVYTDDSKPQFKTSRQMYLMVQEINKKYLGESKTPVTCGTCHRGHETPEPFVAQTTNQSPPQGPSQEQSAAPRAQ